MDEAGFYMMPNLVKTYAPEGKLYTSVQKEAFDSEAIIDFLRHLLRHIEGKLLVVWGGLPAHRSKKVKQFLSDFEPGRVHLEQLPGYAPDLHPDEGIWQHLKNVELMGVCCQHLQALRRELRLAIERLHHKTNVIVGCFRLAGLKL